MMKIVTPVFFAKFGGAARRDASPYLGGGKAEIVLVLLLLLLLVLLLLFVLFF
jgi:hypothetical protein